uniref:Putative conserved secreted protein n=1 Tax=Ornithodoros turicata TaxID=34597 RepID=A0A2R5L9K8_9ACAR
MSSSLVLLLLCAVYAAAQFPFPFPFPFPPIFPIFCGRNEVRGNVCVTPDRRCGSEEGPRPRNTTFCRGCICRPNYVRDSRGNCITQEDCDRCNATAHEEHRNCGTPCPLVCGEPVSRNCSKQCVQGCFCMPGYIRSSRNGTCVPSSQCSPQCPPNSSFTRCRPLFPRVCNVTAILPGIGICFGVGCRCDPGFILGPDRTNCIAEGMCLQDDVQ